MKRVVIASENPVKTEAVRGGFKRMFPNITFDFSSVTVPSGVKEQPFSDEETLLGALTRADNARKEHQEGDYWIGIEGGVKDWNTELLAFAWIVVKSHDLTGKGRTGTFTLPLAVAELIRGGVELGEADDIVFSRLNSKLDNGAVGILTRDVINRKRLYEEGVILSLIQFKNKLLYSSN